MVVVSQRSGRAGPGSSRRALRDLASAGAIVGCVALGIAAVLSPVTSNLRSFVPGVNPVTTPAVTTQAGDVDVEIRPGGARRPAGVLGSTAPAELVLGPSAVAASRTARPIAATPRGPQLPAPVGIPAAADVELPVSIPVLTPPVPLVALPTPEITTQSSVTRPGKGKGPAKKATLPPAQSDAVAAASSSAVPVDIAPSPTSSAETSGPAEDTKGDHGRPDDHPGRVPPHAAVHHRS